MNYQCFQCQAPLPAGTLACPKCGQKFDAPVPAFSPAYRPVVASSPRKNVGLWIAGIVGVILVALLGIGFAGYKAFQNALGPGLNRALGGQEAAAGSEGNWTPNASLTAQLGPAFQVAGPLGLYTLQPPAGFTLSGTKMDAADGKSVIYRWTGPTTPDGTMAEFDVSLGSDGGAMTSHMTSAEYVQIGLLSAGRSHLHLSSSPIQSGSINGLPFARGYWKGIGPRTGRRFHGMVYCQVAAPNLINIVGKDSEPSSQSNLPLFDAAALTLRKQ